jgi:DNA-binding NtrC family response regulator
MDDMKTQEPAIILVEKDNVTLELYQRELCKSFTVYAFTEIDHVLETIENHPDVQAVVIEPEIQSGRGWEWISSINYTFPGRDISVIVCSTRDAKSQPPVRGVTNYLTKPVLPKILREKTIKAIENSAGPK